MSSTEAIPYRGFLIRFNSQTSKFEAYSQTGNPLAAVGRGETPNEVREQIDVWLRSKPPSPGFRFRP